VKLIGRILDKKDRRISLANIRMRNCEPALNKHGIKFPPYFFGTINVILDKPVPTSKLMKHHGSFIIPDEDIVECDRRFKAESWNIIPIKKINGEDSRAFILRTSCNFHGDSVIEVVSRELDIDSDIKYTFDMLRRKYNKLSVGISIIPYLTMAGAVLKVIGDRRKLSGL